MDAIKPLLVKILEIAKENNVLDTVNPLVQALDSRYNELLSNPNEEAITQLEEDVKALLAQVEGGSGLLGAATDLAKKFF